MDITEHLDDGEHKNVRNYYSQSRRLSKQNIV